MKQIGLLIFILTISFVSFSQTNNSITIKKNVLKISPTVTFDWSKSSNLKGFDKNLISGFNINYQREDKNKNYHDVGILIGFVPLSTKKTGIVSGNQLGIEYNYKLVFAKFKNNSLQIYTAVGTQLIYRKLQTANYNLPNFSSNSFIQNFGVAPGLQYSNNKFFFDFSLPTSIGYNITKQKYYYPVYDTNQDYHLMNKNNEKYNLLNLNIGVKAGVGAKF